MAGTAFLSGASEARKRSFEQKENEKSQKLARLNQYITTVVQNPDLTDEAKQYAIQQYSRALGGEILGADSGGGKGKGGKKGKGGEQQGLAGHFTSILKEVATGMTGGKTPKGMQDIDLHTVIGNIAAEIQNPKYSREGVIATNMTGIESALKALPPTATQEDAVQAIRPYLQQIEKVDPQRANAVRNDYLGGYRPGPAIVSEADIRNRAMGQLTGKQGAAPSPGVTAPNPPPGVE
jgi:hypothetical protein